jgi:hypothetical protein
MKELLLACSTNSFTKIDGHLERSEDRCTCALNFILKCIRNNGISEEVAYTENLRSRESKNVRSSGY